MVASQVQKELFKKWLKENRNISESTFISYTEGVLDKIREVIRLSNNAFVKNLNPDLYSYDTLDKYDKFFNLLKNDPNFDIVNKTGQAQSGWLSTPLNHYRRFLEYQILHNANLNNFDINGLRNNLIQYYINKGLTTKNNSNHTVLVLNKNIAEVHFVNKHNKQFKIAINYDLIDKNLLSDVRKVPETHKWTLDGEYWVTSLPTYYKAIDIINSILTNLNMVQNNSSKITNTNIITNQPLNQILYGPPGTGKTYNTVIKAMEIIEPELIQRDVSGNILNYDILKNKFDELKKQGQIEFVTFHQSYSYEEFVEGIKPYIPEWGTVEENNRFIGQDGIFKKICNSAKTTIKGDFEKIYSQFIEEIDENYEFKTKKASFKIRVNDNDGLTIRTGDNFEKETCGTITKEQIKNQTFTSLGRKQKLEAITKYLKEKYGLMFSTSIAVKPHILIIDEINRGDVSKIFGELITLIEQDKRIGKEHQMTVTLPYSREPFGVPNNLYIIGTMNTADRSIALLDAALRRRFDFEEMMPKPELLRGKDIEGVDLEQLLTQINGRIKNEYDRDHQIGHSYLMGVKDKDDLEKAYKNRILPLLNEYFYNDIDSVAKILNCKPNDISLKENWFNVLKEAQKLTKKENEQ